MLLQHYPIDAVHFFQIHTLHQLGFKTRVVLVNKSGLLQPEAETSYRIDVSVFTPQGQLESRQNGIAELLPNQQVLIDAEPFCGADTKQDRLIYFHLIPLRLLPSLTPEKTVPLAKKDLHTLFTSQDHYVEYYRDDGYSSGVLYMSGAMNHPLFGNEWSMLVQAPKVYLSHELETRMSFMNNSPDLNYAREATVKLSLTRPDGSVEKTWQERIRPFVPNLVSCKAPEGFYCLTAVSESSGLIPLTLNYNRKAGTLGIEHCLPPTYYGTDIKGAVRKESIKNLSRSQVFA